MKLRLPTLTLLAALAGCGTPSTPLPMAVGAAEALQLRGWVPEALKAQVGLAPVLGGQDTWRWWGSKVSADALRQALTESLFAVGMAPPAPEPAPRFELKAEMRQLDQPLIPAAGVAVTVAVQYTLTERGSGRVVYQRQLSNVGEVAFSEAMLSPPERLRLANERALRGNITMMLRELVALRP